MSEASADMFSKNSVMIADLAQDKCTSWLDFLIEHHFWGIWLTNICLYPALVVLVLNFLLHLVLPAVGAAVQSVSRKNMDTEQANEQHNP